MSRTVLKTRIIDLAMLNYANDDIAQQVGATRSYVAVAISRARKDGAKIPYRPKGCKPETVTGAMPRIYPIKGLADRHTLQRLRAVSHRRGESVEDLVTELLFVIARDGMFQAVLDDGGET